VLLAGDAAHAHSPAGAQGMNTGLQDAVNLGWKLAAALSGWGPAARLDTYETERHPVGAGVLALSGRQFRLNTVRRPGGRALRWAVHRLVVPLPPVQSRLARDYSGLSIRYQPGPGDHPLAGTRLPPGTITRAGPADGARAAAPAGAARVRLYDLFHSGGFVMLDRVTGGAVAPGADLAGPADGLPGGRVTVARYRDTTATGLPAAALVRPDGYLAWASDEADPAARAAAARAAIRLWCGPTAS
jgi:hypothetical protein